MIGCLNLNAQNYFSRILPTEDNPLIKVLKKVDNQYLIPTDFFSSNGLKGGLLVFKNNEIKEFKFEKLDIGAGSIEVIDNSIFLAGENPLNIGDSLVQISKIDMSDFSLDWCKNYHVGAPRTFNTSLNFLKNNLYTLNVNNLFENEIIPRELFLLSSNIDGDIRWSKHLNTHARLTLGWLMLVSKEENLIISSSINYYDKLGRYSQIIKINEQGDIIWNYEGTEELANGAVPTWATELSDSSILQTYYVDRRNDVDFIVNEWFREPNKFIWLNKDGEFIKEKYIITDKEDFLYYGGVKNGAGDYFYAYGYHEDTRPALLDQIYAHLTKFSNSGDTIWSRNYQHPSYPQGNVTHTIKDILEEENGDITILARITPPAEKSEVWLYKVNSDGCYVNEECEDMRDLTSINTTQASNVTISPNPTSGLINVECSTKIKKIKLIEITGKLIKNMTVNSKSVDFDLLDVDEGIYILQVLDEFSKTINKKIIKM